MALLAVCLKLIAVRAAVLAALRISVADIVRIRSEEQVGHGHAGRIVTVMEHLHPIGDRPVG
jgi:hypothetical protein